MVRPEPLSDMRGGFPGRDRRRTGAPRKRVSSRWIVTKVGRYAVRVFLAFLLARALSQNDAPGTPFKGNCLISGTDGCSRGRRRRSRRAKVAHF
jgi:hypothetical protein